MSDMIERVARAMCQCHQQCLKPDASACCATLIYGWASQEEFIKAGHRCAFIGDEDLRPMARAAIAAMREPTECVLERAARAMCCMSATNSAIHNPGGLDAEFERLWRSFAEQHYKPMARAMFDAALKEEPKT